MLIKGDTKTMKTQKEEYKLKVLSWLAENNLFPKKVRVYDTQYGYEVRVYCPPMEYVSNRSSFRKTEKVIDETNDDGTISKFHYKGTRGRHEIKVPMYIHINEKDFESEDERVFILNMIKDSAILS